MCWDSLDGTDGRQFRRQLGGGEISCWVYWGYIDGTDARLFGRELGGGDISC